MIGPQVVLPTGLLAYRTLGGGDARPLQARNDTLPAAFSLCDRQEPEVAAGCSIQLEMLDMCDNPPGRTTPAEDVEAGAELMGAHEKVVAAGTEPIQRPPSSHTFHALPPII